MKIIYQRGEDAPKAGTGDWYPVRLLDGRTVVVTGMQACARNAKTMGQLREVAKEIAYDADYPKAR